MSNEHKQHNNIGYAYKCGGIPFYPEKHSFFKRAEGVPEEYVESRRNM